MELVPYVFFYGRCQEALDFYKSVFGGSYQAMRVADSPMKDQSPPEAANNIMHASFTAPGVKFFASDGREVKTVDPDAGNISLALNEVDGADAERIVKALADGGKLVMPLEPAFWGGRFAMVVDRFGNEWLITAP
ncbi:MAG: VOC family protein [Candidatus Eremiobacteraeota bacterium]|nr:VOC family protein [Candidatus Eremiobacteraeota bacterium]